MMGRMERWRDRGMQGWRATAFVNASCPLVSPRCKDSRGRGGAGRTRRGRAGGTQGERGEGERHRPPPSLIASFLQNPTKPAKPTQVTPPGKTCLALPKAPRARKKKRHKKKKAQEIKELVARKGMPWLIWHFYPLLHSLSFSWQTRRYVVVSIKSVSHCRLTRF